MRDIQRETQRIEQFLDISRAYRAENPERSLWRGANLVAEEVERLRRDRAELQKWLGAEISLRARLVGRHEEDVEFFVYRFPLRRIISLRLRRWLGKQ